MQEVFEKIIEKLEELKEHCNKCCLVDYNEGAEVALCEAISIARKESEKYNNGWIPCSKRLPEEAFGCLVVVEDTEPMTGQDFETILPYFVGYDSGSWCDSEGQEIPFEVIAWQPLPKCWKGENNG